LESLFQKAFDCLSYPAALVDQNGTIIAVNQVWRDLYENTVVYENKIAEGNNYIKACEQPGSLHTTGGKSFAVGLRAVLDRDMDRFEMEYSALGKGGLQWVLERANGLEINGLRFAFIVQQDITEYKVRNNQSLTQSTQLPTLVATVKSLISMLDLQELLNTILLKLYSLIRYNAAAVFTFDAGNIIRKAYQGPPLSINLPITLTPREGYPEIQKLVSTESAFFIQNINQFPDLLLEICELLCLDQSNLGRFPAWLFLPMIVNENQIGMMVLAYHQNAYYNHAALRIGEMFAHFAAIALQNAHLYELSKNTAILAEKNRLAYELHDSIAQSLYSLNLYANAAQKALETDRLEVAHRHLGELKRLSGEAVGEMRLMIFELENQILEEFGLEKAIKARFKAIESKYGIKADLKLVGRLALPNRVEREVFGIVQDLLIYIEKTTPMKALSIEMGDSIDCIQISIECYPIVDPSEINEDVDISRLNRIRNRVKKIGGNLKFEQTSKQTTMIKLYLEH